MRSLASLILIGVAAPLILAQSAPRISTVLPAGGKAGTTVEVVVFGQDFDDLENLIVSFPGAKIESLGPAPVDDKSTKKTTTKKAAAPTAATRFSIAIPADTPLGLHDLRVVGKHGVSNPRAFHIGDQPEIAEKEPNDDVPQAQRIPLGTTVNGVINPAVDVDYFQFAGKKGDRVVVSCLTTSIDSKLPAAIELYTMSGRPLGGNRGYQNNDAVVDAVLPEDGDYLIRLFGFTHTLGAPDYAYRLTVGALPWIDAVVPATVPFGAKTKVVVFGRNLPGGVRDDSALLDGRPLERLETTVAPTISPGTLDSRTLSLAPRLGLDGFDFQLRNKAGASNPYFLAASSVPVAVEIEPNEIPTQATAMAVPSAVSGRLDARETDWFRFPAKKGMPLLVELVADRLNPGLLGSALDLKFTVQGPDGKTLATVDDNPEVPLVSFFNRSDDPGVYRLLPQADGEHRVGVSSSDGLGDARQIYTLRIIPEAGDFRVVALPASLATPDGNTVTAGGRTMLNVHVLRQGSFEGDVVVRGKTLPPGVSVKPQTIAGNQRHAAVVIEASVDAPPFVGPIELEAEARIDDEKRVVTVRPATLVYPVALPTQPSLSRLDREMILAVRGKAPFRLEPSSDAIVIRSGEKISLTMTMTPLEADFKGPVNLTGIELPGEMKLQAASLAPGKATAVSFDFKTPLPPGQYNLVIRGQTQPVGVKTAKMTGANIIEHAPPIALTVTPKK